MTAEPAPPPRRPPDSVGRSLAFLSIATIVQQVGAFVLSVALRAVLGPAKTGIWNLAEVWRQQLSSVTLGASSAADRDMPELRAQGRREEEQEVRSVAFTFTLCEAGVIGLGFLVYWLAQRHTFEPSEALALALAPLMAVLTSYVSLYQLFLKNLKEFRIYAYLFAGQVLVDWAVLPLALLGGLDALLIGLAVGWALRAGLYWAVVRRQGLFRLGLSLRRAVLAPMLRFGLLLSVVGLLHQLLLRLDSLVVGMSLGTPALGLYYLGPQVAAAAAAIPLSLSVIAWPNLMESYGRGGREELLPHLERYLRPVGLVVSPLATAVAVFGVAVVVNGFLPDFRPGLDAMQVFILTTVFIHSISLLHQTLVAVRHIRLLIGLSFLAVAVQATLLGIGSIGGLSLTTAAWSAVAGQATLALALLVTSCRLLRVSRADLVRFWGRVPLCWAAMLAFILAIEAVAPEARGLLESLAVAAGQTAAFIVVALGALAVLDRRALHESRELMRGHG